MYSDNRFIAVQHIKLLVLDWGFSWSASSFLFNILSNNVRYTVQYTTYCLLYDTLVLLSPLYRLVHLDDHLTITASDITSVLSKDRVLAWVCCDTLLTAKLLIDSVH